MVRLPCSTPFNAPYPKQDLPKSYSNLKPPESTILICSELNGWFNPQQDQRAALMKIEMVKASTKFDREQLYHLRTQLVRHLDPLKSTGNELQEMLLNCNRLAMGEVEGID